MNEIPLNLQLEGIGKPFPRLLGKFFGILGWTVKIEQALPRKCVVIGAPHTSNWDFPLTLMLMAITGLRFHWVGKDTIFRPPFGWLFRRLGGIPVNRRMRNNFVASMVEAFRTNDDLLIAIPPEGTRGKMAYWKTGFYYIAAGASVPVVLGYADYKHKIVGLGPILTTSGDIQADFVAIRQFYKNITGKYPHRQSDIKIQNHSSLDINQPND